MEIPANYIDDITGTMLAVIKKLYTQRLKEEGFSFEDRRKLLKDFNEKLYDLEFRFGDEIGYALCANGRLNATFNEMTKNDDKNNIFVNLNCVMLAYLGQSLEEVMPRHTKINIKGDTHSVEIRIVCGNKSFNTTIVDLACSKNKSTENNEMER